MTAPAPVIRWDETHHGGWTGHVTGIDGWLFQIWTPGHGDAEFELATAVMPGMKNSPCYGTPDLLKGEAEERLRDFAGRLAAAFGAGWPVTWADSDGGLNIAPGGAVLHNGALRTVASAVYVDGFFGHQAVHVQFEGDGLDGESVYRFPAGDLVYARPGAGDGQ